MANNIYKEIYSKLSNHGEFLYNYGSELSIAGSYEKSTEILNRSKLFLCNSNLFLYLGRNSAMLGAYDNAQKQLKIASNICPSKFIPKYYLLKLYIDIGRTQEAVVLANKIIAYPIKVLHSLLKKSRIMHMR